MGAWNQVMKMKSKDNRHKGVANTLLLTDIHTIIATAEYFDINYDDIRQMYFDLAIAKYRVFDWLAMGVMGRMPSEITKLFVYSFLKNDGDVTKFIEDLRSTDYDIVRDWQKVDLN